MASLNLLNLRENSNDDKYAKLSLYIREVLGSPDVIGVQEVYLQAALAKLATRISTDDSNVVYTAHVVQTANSQAVGFLVRSGVTVEAGSPTEHGSGETFVDPRDNSRDPVHDRLPLMLKASVGDFAFTVIDIHNRSLIGVDEAARGGWIRTKRLAQAQSVARLVQQENAAGAKVIVVGDFNAYQFTDGYVDVVGQIKGNPRPSRNLLSGPDLVEPNLCNLVDGLPALQQYSLLFEGTPQALDHALVNRPLSRHVVEMQFGRGNADAAGAEASNAANALRASDHDGFVVYFSTTDRGRSVCPAGLEDLLGDGEPPPPPGGTADLSLRASSRIVSPDRLSYRVNVRNAGPDEARNVRVASTLEARGDFEASTGGCEEDPNGLPTCSLGRVEAGETVSFTIDVVLEEPSENLLTYSGAVDSDALDPNPDNDASEMTTPVGTPPAPTDLVATALNETEIELRWRDNSRTETHFDVLQQGPGDSRLRLIRSVPANTTSVVVGDLVPNITYNFAVAARNGQLRSERTPVATATTWADAGLRLDAQGEVVAEGLVRYTVSVRNVGPEDASRVVVTSSLTAAEGDFAASTTGCREDPDGLPECGLGDIEVGDSDSFTIDVAVDATNRTSLTYSGAARDVADPRPPDDTVELVLPLGRPAAPSHLQASAVSGMEVELHWRDNSDRETGFGVFLQGPGDSKLRLIGTVPANTTSMVVNELVPSITYSFAVEARNGELRSGRTRKAMATTWVLESARCGEDDALCLGTFQAEVEWDDGKGRTGRGFAERLTADAGDFWFFDSANIELVVKVLDGCAINDHYWVYAAGLTDVEVTMTVRDLRNGVEKSWTNPLGTRFRPITDASAFATCDDASSAKTGNRVVLSGAPRGRAGELHAAALSTADPIDSASSACAAGDANLCLSGSRFKVRADWQAGGRSGAATAIPRTTDTGMFWFFSEDNVELVVKVLDGCRENGYRWVLLGGLTDVGVEVTVTDSDSGRARMYRSLEGLPFASMFDVTAFACEAGR